MKVNKVERLSIELIKTLDKLKIIRYNKCNKLNLFQQERRLAMDIKRLVIDTNKVKAARVSKGMTQAEMAKHLEVSPNTYSEKENGNTEFKLKEAFVMAEILDMDIRDIFFYSNVELNSTNHTA